MTREELGEVIATVRKEQGITIRKMAEMARLSTRAVQAVEKGWYNVGIDTYTALATALGTELQIKAIERTRSEKQ